jgi:hypothetical protein
VTFDERIRRRSDARENEEAIDVPIMSEQGVMWTDQTVVLLGEYVDATLVVDPTVLG